MVWVMLRISVTLSMILATSGSRSVTCKPGTTVATGLCGPRMPSGASGFMSNMSMWLGPPNWKRNMTVLARTGGAAAVLFSSAANKRGSERPSRPRPPICRALRHVRASELKLGQAKLLVMADTDDSID